ncbi:MAG: DUF1223 domain-containing protein [Gammaproteobacteria bacterium]|nr:DUF1223 domain-containing protein [Gammaproteobacteria bacterium]
MSAILKRPAMLFALALLCGARAFAGEPLLFASAGAKTPLVELYTSEGCSSCPPADNWLRALGESLHYGDGDGDELRAVPLAFHVDYWNYLGWTDPFAKKAFTKRQRNVAATNRTGVYTPATIVDGRESWHGGKALRAIKAANAQTAEARIEVRVSRGEDGEITAEITLNNRSARALHAHLAVYENGITRRIGAGENNGRTLRHDFVVRHWSAPMRMRRGENRKTVTLALPPDWQRRNLGLAVVALGRRGETVQAAAAPLAPLFPG